MSTEINYIPLNYDKILANFLKILPRNVMTEQSKTGLISCRTGYYLQKLTLNYSAKFVQNK